MHNSTFGCPNLSCAKLPSVGRPTAASTGVRESAVYQRQVLSKAPVSGIVLKLSDIGKLAFDDAPDVYWNLLREQANVESLTLVSALNNLLLRRLVESRSAWSYQSFERTEDAPAFLTWQPQTI